MPSSLKVVTRSTFIPPTSSGGGGSLVLASICMSVVFLHADNVQSALRYLSDQIINDCCHLTDSCSVQDLGQCCIVKEFVSQTNCLQIVNQYDGRQRSKDETLVHSSSSPAILIGRRQYSLAGVGLGRQRHWMMESGKPTLRYGY